MATVTSTDLNPHQHTDNRLAPLMFGLAVVFLGLLAGLIVTWVDIPRVVELSALESGDDNISADMIRRLESADAIGHFITTWLFLLWPVFIAEALYQFTQAKAVKATRKQLGLRLAAACVPPLRLGTPSLAWNGQVWLPTLSWVQPSKLTTLTLTRFFGKPMIAIALSILPILLLEYGFKNYVANHVWLQTLIHVATGFIWFAFTFEFIVMVSVTDKKLKYIKKNWIDLAIILLPLISFLRSIRALRLAKLAKVQQLAKMGRIYRMRGLGMKLFRALMLLEVVNRILRITPERRLAKLESLREEHLEELAELDEEIAQIKQRLHTQD